MIIIQSGTYDFRYLLLVVSSLSADAGINDSCLNKSLLIQTILPINDDSDAIFLELSGSEGFFEFFVIGHEHERLGFFEKRFERFHR